MNQNEYIEKRLNDQIEWYDKKSQLNQKLFKLLQVSQLVIAALIPFLTGYLSNDTSFLKFIVGLSGVIVAVIAGILGLYKFHENWIEYRTVCESLRHEKYLFLTKTDPYNIEEPFPLLVQRTETLISKENTNWSQYMTKPTKSKK